MHHLLITAGGTAEPIDGVRRITNTATGRLGTLIYEALSEYLAQRNILAHSSFTVHYVVSDTGIRPEPKNNLPVVFYPVTDVKSVEAAIKAAAGQYPIEYVIHSMAVSDFTTGYLIERDRLANDLADVCLSNMCLPFEQLKNEILSILQKPPCALAASEKVSSKEELILSLVKTPKIIEDIKKMLPNCCLVGFKLLKNASESELIRIGSELAERNGCDFVLANDMSGISGDRHEGILLHNGSIVDRYCTKKEIAAGIIRNMLEMKQLEALP